MEVISGIFSESFWWVAPILVTMTTAITGLINQSFKISNGIWPQLIAWLVGSGLSVGAWGIKLIEFGDPIWLGIVCLCIVTGLASNGVYDIPVIKNWIDTWFTEKPGKKD